MWINGNDVMGMTDEEFVRRDDSYSEVSYDDNENNCWDDEEEVTYEYSACYPGGSHSETAETAEEAVQLLFGKGAQMWGMNSLGENFYETTVTKPNGSVIGVAHITRSACYY